MTAKKFKCAVIQLHPKPMQMEANFQRAKTFIQQAATEGAELAVLPEYCLTSWVPKEPHFADAADDRTYLAKFCVRCPFRAGPCSFTLLKFWAVGIGKRMQYQYCSRNLCGKARLPRRRERQGNALQRCLFHIEYRRCTGLLYKKELVVNT